MKKQNIEDIFSSIENFSSVPPPELWDNIEEKLHPRKKKKATIIWWALAASLLIGLSIPSVLYFNSNTQDSNSLQNNSVVQEKNSNPDKNNTISTSKNNSEKNIKLNKVQEPAIVSSEAENSAQSKNENNILNKNTVSNNASNQNADLKAKTHSKQNAVVNVASNQGENSKVKTYHIQNSNSNQYSNTNSYIDENVISKKGVTIVSNSKSKEEVNISAEKETLNNNPVIVSNAISKNNKNTISQYETEPKSNTKNDVSLTEKRVVIDSKNGSPESLIKDKAVAGNSKNNSKSDVSPTGKAVVIDSKNGSPEKLINDKAVANNSKNNTKSDVSPTGKAVVIDSKNGSSEKLIKDKAVASNSKSDVLLTGQDSIQLAVLQNLEKTIAEGKSKKEEEPKSVVPSNEKWSLEVFAGVANSENLKKEKTLGNVNGSKQTNAYGVKTNYKLNKKWTVSSGVKINELGQSIADVSYMDTSNTSGLLSSSDYLIKNVTTVSQITNNSNYVFVTTNAKNSLKSDNFQTGNIDQSLKYIEIPLEVSYALFNRNKTSISLNTGGVVGKLISNNLYLNGTSIGSNSDANDFIYGSLLSSTLQYRIYKKTHIFVEPGMNYYINPLNNQSFNQFQWAFNFGLNVSF